MKLKTYNFDECVVAGQNVFLWPTIHLTRQEYYLESHYFRIQHM